MSIMKSPLILIIGSLSVFCLIESAEITAFERTDSVNKISVRKGEHIEIKCEYKLEGDEKLVSIKMNHGNNPLTQFYEYIEGDKAVPKLTNITGSAIVTDGKHINKSDSVKLYDEKLGLSGKYTCDLTYSKADKSQTPLEKEITLQSWDGDFDKFEFTIHTEDGKKDKNFQKGENLVLNCNANTTATNYTITILHQGHKLATKKMEPKKDAVNETFGVDGIEKKDVDIIKDDKSKMSVKLSHANEKMKGDYQCEFKVYIDNKDNTWIQNGLIQKVEVNGVKGIFNFSYSLIALSMISIFFSITN